MSDLSLTNDYIEATDRIARHVLTQEIKQRAESSTLPPVTYNNSLFSALKTNRGPSSSSKYFKIYLKSISIPDLILIDRIETIDNFGLIGSYYISLIFNKVNI